jgi:hypothetical protein
MRVSQLIRRSIPAGVSEMAALIFVGEHILGGALCLRTARGRRRSPTTGSTGNSAPLGRVASLGRLTFCGKRVLPGLSTIGQRICCGALSLREAPMLRRRRLLRGAPRSRYTGSALRSAPPSSRLALGTRRFLLTGSTYSAALLPVGWHMVVGTYLPRVAQS